MMKASDFGSFINKQGNNNGGKLSAEGKSTQSGDFTFANGVFTKKTRVCLPLLLLSKLTK